MYSLIRSIVYAMDWLVQIINLLILVRVILSWINISPYSGLGRFIYSVTEPIMAPIRNLIYGRFGYSGMIDFTPFVAVLLVNALYNYILRNLIVRLLLLLV
ncbi:YggT family protein [Alkaliphilus crotonatoxidans]